MKNDLQHSRRDEDTDLPAIVGRPTRRPYERPAYERSQLDMATQDGGSSGDDLEGKAS